MALDKVDSRLLDSYTETAQATTSGTSIDFTDIPADVKRITVMFSGVSTSGTSNVQVQIGDSGGIETTGYLGASSYIGTTVNNSGNYTTGFVIRNATAAATRHGSMIISLIDASTNTWVVQGVIGDSSGAVTVTVGYTKVLSAALDRLRITTENGTDTFDAGSVNIMYG